jgi:hypothetical protein
VRNGLWKTPLEEWNVLVMFWECSLKESPQSCRKFFASWIYCCTEFNVNCRANHLGIGFKISSTTVSIGGCNCWRAALDFDFLTIWILVWRFYLKIRSRFGSSSFFSRSRTCTWFIPTTAYLLISIISLLLWLDLSDVIIASFCELNQPLEHLLQVIKALEMTWY